jgi:Rod binding domain-containing protein
MNVTAPSWNSSSLAKKPDENSKEYNQRIANEFESMFLGEMVKSMRKTIPGQEEMSHGRKIFTDLLDKEYSRIAGHSQSNGLAGLIFRQLERQSTNPEATPLKELQKDAARTAVDTAEVFLQNQKPLHDLVVKTPIQINEKSTPVDKIKSNTTIDRPYSGIINQAAAKHQLDPNLIHAVMQKESAGKSFAVSRVGAKGLMQLMDGTAKDMGVKNSFDPIQNINGGAKYLKKMLKRHDGDVSLALAAYNAGPGNVKKYGGIPPFKETQNYVKDVTELYKEYQNVD